MLIDTKISIFENNGKVDVQCHCFAPKVRRLFHSALVNITRNTVNNYK